MVVYSQKVTTNVDQFSNDNELMRPSLQNSSYIVVSLKVPAWAHYYLLYSNKLFEIIKHHFPTVHCYADDAQVYISFCPNDSLDQLNAAELLESCIDDIRAWMLHLKVAQNNFQHFPRRRF